VDAFPTQVEIGYASTDDCPILFYEIRMNGLVLSSMTREPTIKAYLLKPSTKYTFTVRARDLAGHVSVFSDPLVVTTPPADPNDHTAPTAPPGLYDNGVFGDGEVWVFWSDSTDNVTPSERIRYDVFLNGVYDGSAIELKRHITYLTLGQINTLEFRAVDEAGNVSAASTLVYDLR
jgi:hypothetical protein